MGAVGSIGSEGSLGSFGDSSFSAGSLRQCSDGSSGAVRRHLIKEEIEIVESEACDALAHSFKEAVKEGNVDEVRSLLEQNANVNQTFQMGLTPLHFSALHGNLETSKLLLEARANACAITADSQLLTPRALAEVESHDEIAKLLADAMDAAPRIVTLHIYDLGKDSAMKVVNEVLSSVGTGAFHVGVEVFGTEYSYGYTPLAAPGIVAGQPRQSPGHTFRQSVVMGETTLSQQDVDDLINNMSNSWHGNQYDILTRNCAHFSDSFCRWLAVGPIPEWILSLSAAGASLNQGVNAAAVAARHTAILAVARAHSLDQKLGLSEAIEASGQQLRLLDESLSLSETLSQSAEYNQRKLRELDEALRISETVSMSSDYNHRKLRELDSHLKISEKTVSMSADCKRHLQGLLVSLKGRFHSSGSSGSIVDGRGL
eukprot:TRINITY_DN49176_c0_g1_i1.p1 TRINITY_DN49176_c0_g1~~TRINITY_DN49176_c0_g1_i1.p1  ORF type:complete len:436 (+),score=72.36 TRINITY_DN49176_c0_g1_i1:22-1308(+)